MATTTTATTTMTSSQYNHPAISYEKLHAVAKSAHQCLTDTLRLLTASGSDSNSERSNGTHDVNVNTSKSLQSLGQTLYTLIRNNPRAFRDSSPSFAADNGSVGNNSHQGQVSSQESMHHQHEGAASAYMRHVSATLVLINCFSFGNHDDVRKCPSLLASQEKLIFGLITFVRAGRAMLIYAENPLAAYDTLFLAISCWKELHQQQQKATNIIERQSDQYLDAAFHAYSLLPDAAYLVYSCMEPKQIVGSPHHVLQLINDLSEFVQNHCLPLPHNPPCSQKQQTQTSTASLLFIQKFLPTLARLAYKVSFCFDFDNFCFDYKHA